MSNEVGQEAQPETDIQPEAANAEVENASEAASDEQEESATSENDELTSPRKDKGVGKRINELTREKYEAKREAERLHAELEALRREQPQPKAEPTRSKPTLESCGWDPEAFAEAVADWTIEQKFAERETSMRAAQQAKVEAEKAADFKSRVQKLEEVSPGAWERAVNAPIRTTEPMIEVIRESEVGPHIAIWLADNLDEADAISNMSPYQAAKMLGQVEAMIQGNLRTSSKQATSNAPPPPPRVAGSAPSVKTPEAMTMAEYVAWRNKAEGKRR